MKNNRRITKRIPRRTIKDCIFCKHKKNPDYKDVENLRHFITERGKILGRRDTGVCQKHQTILTISVKRARYLALLPFVVRPS